MVSQCCNIFFWTLCMLNMMSFLVASEEYFKVSHESCRYAYSCSYRLTYFQNVSGLFNDVNCTEIKNQFMSKHQIAWGIELLVAIAWLLDHSTKSVRWILSKMLSLFFIIYPLVLNCVKIKIDELCESKRNADDSYVIQQAVVNDILINRLDIFILLSIIFGSPILFLFYY